MPSEHVKVEKNSLNLFMVIGEKPRYPDDIITVLVIT